jgi:RimJ/RimL family protein N-acetyltransferase
MSAMLEPFTRDRWPEVARFARRLPNFSYLETIVRLHAEEKRPGGCYVWREEGRSVAFCGLGYLNLDDAWLYGMRVDPELHNRGIGSRFTRALFRIAARDGRTWVGLNTSDHHSHRSVFRIAQKLGMKLEGVFCNDGLWSLQSRLPVPRLRRHPDILAEFRGRGHTAFFHDTPAWYWSRLLPARREWVNAGGCIWKGVPLRVTHQARPDHRKSTTINLLELPPDPRPLLTDLLAFVRGRDWIVVNYPLELRRRVRAAWKELVPALRAGRNCYRCTERVYGKYL